jgi:hypothetical protein
MVRDLGVDAVLSVHFEYEMPHDRAKSARPEVRKETIAVMKRDVEAITSRLQMAGLE